MKPGRKLIRQRKREEDGLVFSLFLYYNEKTCRERQGGYEESSRQSGWVLLMAKQIAEGLGIDGPWLTEHLIRKTAHFLEYGVLGVLLWNCIRAYGWRRERLCLAQLWLGTVIPLTDETIQLVTPGRSGQVSDVWLDMSGLLFGTLAAVAVHVLWKRFRGKTGKEVSDGKAGG